jgi:hypothetical protein
MLYKEDKMKYILQVLVSIFIVVTLAGDSLYAERIFTDSDLRKYEGESPDSAEGSDSKGNLREKSSNTKDEQKAIQLCKNAISSGITDHGRYYGVKSVKLKELTPSKNAEDLLYIISFDAHLEIDIISPVECWVYKKEDGKLLYRITSKE